jgi:glycosyltransferase involved in cell wall biosynthesis
MNELVSILIPAYNCQKFISQTISSALNQTYKKKEIIVVNDGSTDNTLEIIKSYESKYVKIVSQDNSGACGARNKALNYAQGNYIQWLDGDDLLHPEKVSMQLNRREEGGDSSSLLTCAWGKFFFRWQKTKFIADSLWQDLEPVEWMLRKFSDNVWMNPSVWLISRKLTDLAGPWDERLSFSGDDDGEYICRVVAACEKVKFVSEAKAFYRIGNPASLDAGMGKSHKKLEALLLSLELSINCLLRLEDSQRTRAACVKHLQTWFPLFYDNEYDFMLKIEKLAERLGGKMTPPIFSWKYRPIEKLFGRKSAVRTKTAWNNLKTKIYCKLDRYLSDAQKDKA